ncbi:hypothetical protein EI94DRAFT_1018709 [Lactarius quietus]|nr:hypothetical protein EI94DRAFT_1018709 [Lactarius quietus]
MCSSRKQYYRKHITEQPSIPFNLNKNLRACADRAKALFAPSSMKPHGKNFYEAEAENLNRTARRVILYGTVQYHLSLNSHAPHLMRRTIIVSETRKKRRAPCAASVIAPATWTRVLLSKKTYAAWPAWRDPEAGRQSDAQPLADGSSLYSTVRDQLPDPTEPTLKMHGARMPHDVDSTRSAHAY